MRMRTRSLAKRVSDEHHDTIVDTMYSSQNRSDYRAPERLGNESEQQKACVAKNLSRPCPTAKNRNTVTPAQSPPARVRNSANVNLPPTAI